MKRLLSVLVATNLMILGVVAPADAKPNPPPPDGCTYGKGMTSCTDTTQTTEPGPQDGMACTAGNGMPGTYSQERTTTTTTTTTYKGKSTSGTPTSTNTTSTTQDGPATCEANPVVSALTLTPNPVCTATVCYTGTGVGLEPGSTVTLHYTTVTDSGTSTAHSTARGTVGEDGTYSNSFTVVCGDW